MALKDMMNSLASKSTILYQLSAEERELLKACLLEMYSDIRAVCQKYNLTIMLGGGSALGCVRHQGFIPWDDDLDLMMPRADYEFFKQIFELELGERYELLAPNYGEKAKSRFPKIMKKGTTFKEISDVDSDLPCGVFLDIFLIENVPQSHIHRKLKGIWCNGLMFLSSHVYLYEHRSEELKKYMSGTVSGKRSFQFRMLIGKLFHFFSAKKWFDLVDQAVQYGKETGCVTIPTGRKHYFGEILQKSVLLPVSIGDFCGQKVPIPGDYDAYLKNLYGNYMLIPPEEKREKHFIVDFKLNF